MTYRAVLSTRPSLDLGACPVVIAQFSGVTLPVARRHLLRLIRFYRDLYPLMSADIYSCSDSLETSYWVVHYSVSPCFGVVLQSRSGRTQRISD